MMNPRRRLALLLVLLLAPHLTMASDPGRDPAATHEPRPPELLSLAPLGPLAEDGVSTIELVISPEIDADVEVELLEPADAEIEGRQRRLRHPLVRGGATIRERIRVPLRAGRESRLRVRLSVLGADGKPWLVIERSLTLNARERPAAGARRLPVVRVLPDQTRIVEYVEEVEAGGGGNGSGGAGASTPAPATDTRERDAGGDPLPERRSH